MVLHRRGLRAEYRKGSCSFPAKEEGWLVAGEIHCQNGTAGRSTRSICTSGEKRGLGGSCAVRIASEVCTALYVRQKKRPQEQNGICKFIITVKRSNVSLSPFLTDVLYGIHCVFFPSTNDESSLLSPFFKANLPEFQKTRDYMWKSH